MAITDIAPLPGGADIAMVDRIQAGASGIEGDKGTAAVLVLASLERAIRDSIEPGTPDDVVTARITAFRMTADICIRSIIDDPTIS